MRRWDLVRAARARKAWFLSGDRGLFFYFRVRGEVRARDAVTTPWGNSSASISFWLLLHAASIGAGGEMSRNGLGGGTLLDALVCDPPCDLLRHRIAVDGELEGGGDVPKHRTDIVGGRTFKMRVESYVKFAVRGGEVE
jgi:hypothetical protein